VERIAVFSGSVLRGEASGDLMTGIMMLQNRADQISLTTDTGRGEEAYAILMRAGSDISVSESGGGYLAGILCRGSLSVRGKSGYGDDAGTARLLPLFEREARLLVSRAYGYVTRNLGVDLFGVEWRLALLTSAETAGEYLAAEGIPGASVRCDFQITG
jgi:hypothetical protein